MPKFVRLLALALLATVSVTVLTPSAAQAESDPPGVSCSQQTAQVTLSPTDATLYNLVGRLCLKPATPNGGGTVQLLVPGITYDHSYFNSSISPTTYSYVFAAAARGYSTFAIDRLGTGLSDHPAPNLLTTQSHVKTTVEVVAGYGGSLDVIIDDAEEE